MAEGKPVGWTFSTANGTLSKESTIIATGNSAVKISDVTKTYNLIQEVDVKAGKTYEIEINYYIDSGDGTDARIWCNFQKEGNPNPTAWSMALADSLNLKGPGGEKKYFSDVKKQWNSYKTTVVAPEGYSKFSFQVRTYKGATVYWDDMFFGEKAGSGFSNPSNELSSFFVQNSELIVKNVEIGTAVEFYNALGAKVQTSVFDGSGIDLSNLSKGIYIVRAGKHVQKIMF